MTNLKWTELTRSMIYSPKGALRWLGYVNVCLYLWSLTCLEAYNPLTKLVSNYRPFLNQSTIRKRQNTKTNKVTLLVIMEPSLERMILLISIRIYRRRITSKTYLNINQSVRKYCSNLVTSNFHLVIVRAHFSVSSWWRRRAKTRVKKLSKCTLSISQCDFWQTMHLLPYTGINKIG